MIRSFPINFLDLIIEQERQYGEEMKESGGGMSKKVNVHFL